MSEGGPAWSALTVVVCTSAPAYEVFVLFRVLSWIVLFSQKIGHCSFSCLLVRLAVQRIAWRLAN